VTLDIGSYASPGRGILPGDYAIAKRLEFEIDLTQSESSLWGRVDIKRRQRIRKATKAGVQVKMLSGEEGSEHLRRLQESSFARIAARGGPTLGDHVFESRDPVSTLVNASAAVVIGGFVNGACVTASFFTVFNGLAYHALSGHDDKALASQAPSLVLWEMMAHFAAEGVTKLNLGGCGIDALDARSSEHGVYTYKRAFGGNTLECESGHKVLRPAVRRIAGLLRRAGQ
jgi:lipid II:glycine glycyltransferase (peptidoglycan interpeptide bridge formation enzyme)